MAKCRVCSAPHKACGPTTTVTPIDLNVSQNPGGTMALNEYEVTIDGRHPHTTTMLLSDEDAKRLGVYGTEAKAVKPATNKARKPAANKAAPAKSRKPVAPKTAKPAAPKAPTSASVEDATDPDASE